MKLFPDEFERVNFFKLTDGSEVVTYLSAVDLNDWLSDYQLTQKVPETPLNFSPEAFCEHINEHFHTQVIKILRRTP